MLFNSFEFILFLILSFLAYWAFFYKTVRLRNFYILFLSYVFYGWWDWRFLILIFISSVADYFVGINLEKYKEKRTRQLLLSVSLIINLGILGFFKYFNFFIESFIILLDGIGFNSNFSSLSIILPVGISFYTFQTLSYSIDVYRKEIKPSNDIVAFLSYVSFFPQLVAGPIERAKSLLPQFGKVAVFNYSLAKEGLSQILYGFFLKLLVADNCAKVVDSIFSNYQNQDGLSLFLGGGVFAFQIYGDFAGYSSIAIGVGKLFGFKLRTNFLYPYFSRDIAEFWRRWHISLSSWFKDYVYIPLGGSKGSITSAILNVFIIFLVSGFWHGANWTFIIWGGINASFFIPLFVFGLNRKNVDTVAQNSLLPSFKEFIQILITFTIVSIAWIFFRSPSVNDAFRYIYLLAVDNKGDGLPAEFDNAILWIFVCLCFDWFGRHYDFPYNYFKNKPRLIRWVFHITLLVAILIFTQYHSQSEFIYFQF